MVHEIISVFTLYSDEESRPVRITIFYIKTTILMALTSIFGDEDSLNMVQIIVFTLLCVAAMGPVVSAIKKGFVKE